MSKKASKKAITTDHSTEQKIKDAAQRVFIRKGFSATTTREISDEAGINYALLHYYFRSKEKLFDVVAHEQVAIFFGGIYPIVNNETTSLEEKIEAIVAYYTKILLAEPGLVLFVLSEMQTRPERISELMKANRGLTKAVIARQMREVRPDIHPMQLLMSMLGVILFPFIGREIFQQSMDIDKNAFTKMLKERVKLLPALIKAMFSI
jgi:AcrR family transcriptional regulator